MSLVIDDPRGSAAKDWPAPAVDPAATTVQKMRRDENALRVIVDTWLKLSPAGRAYILPNLIEYEENHRAD